MRANTILNHLKVNCVNKEDIYDGLKLCRFNQYLTQD